MNAPNVERTYRPFISKHDAPKEHTSPNLASKQTWKDTKFPYLECLSLAEIIKFSLSTSPDPILLSLESLMSRANRPSLTRAHAPLLTSKKKH